MDMFFFVIPGPIIDLTVWLTSTSPALVLQNKKKTRYRMAWQVLLPILCHHPFTAAH